MLHVDQRRVGRLGGVVILASGGFTAGILRGGDNFEILILQFGIEFLPAWQIIAASSPGGPGDHQHFLAAKILEVDDFSGAIRHRKIGCLARFGIRAGQHRNFAEAPYT